MKRRSLLCAGMGVVMSTSMLAAVNILPRPVEVKARAGTFTVTSETRISYEPSSESAREVAEYLASVLKPASGLPLPCGPATAGTANSIALLVGGVPKDLGEEGYTLDASPDGIVVRAKAAQGLFYGVQTLRQLLPAAIMGSRAAGRVEWSVPLVSISDKPRFPWRGMHLDVCRHFFPVEDVLKYIDLLAFYKMNVFHLHLTDDQGWRIEIKKYPRLTEFGSSRAESPKRGNRNQGDGTPYGPYFYSQEDIRVIVDHARRRHITVVPEIELPGHSLAALVAYPDLGCKGGPYKVRTRWGIEPDIYCAGNENVFEFLESVLTETLALFPSEFVHIGGDEAPKKRWEQCPKCQARIKAEGLGDEHELQSYFIRRIEKFLNSKGRRLIGWDEILEGGLAPNASVMSWRGIKGGIAAAKAGHDVVMSPTSHCYFDFYQGRDKRNEPEAIGGYLPLKQVYAYEPVPAALSDDGARHVLGAQGNVWTEYIHDYAHVEYMAAPRMIALSEVVWSPAEGKDYATFMARLLPHAAHLDAAGVHYRKLEPEPMVVGAWRRGQAKETWTVSEWDVSGAVNAPGNYRVTFQYTGGACRLDVQSVELLVNGSRVARDAHWATTGARNEANVYSLKVGTLPAGAKVVIKAEIRCDGGTDSTGEIYLGKE